MKQTHKMDAMSQVLDKTQCYISLPPEVSNWAMNFRQQTICENYWEFIAQMFHLAQI